MKTLWYKTKLWIGQHLYMYGLKVSMYGTKMCEKVPYNYKTYDPAEPRFPVGPPIMDETVKDQLDELLKARSDLQQFSSQIVDTPCEVPPIKRGGCEVQTGAFRRVECLDGDK